MVSTLKKLILCTFFACGVAAPLSACDAGDFVDVPATSVEFSSPTLDLFVGQRVALKYSVAPSAARNDKAYWFSSNESVCYVTDGVLMGIGAGDAKISLVLGGQRAELNVHVIDGGSGDVKSINLSTRSMTVGVGKTAPLKAYVNPKSEVVTWVSSNPAVADYSDGNVIANSVGECDITASISDNLSASCHITVTNDAPPGPSPGGDEGWTGNIRVGAPMGEMDFMKSLLAKFNSDTGSSVTFEVTQWEEGNGPDNLPQSLADGPDIYPYVSDQTIGFYQRNALAQLPNSAVADIKAKMGDKYANYAKLNGTSKYIGYPFASDNGYVMFYNKTMAASAGITDMSNVSMTELLQAAKAKDYEVDFPINNAFYAAGSLMSYSKDESGNAKSLYTLTMKSGGTSYSVASTFDSAVGIAAAKQIRGLFDYTGTLMLATDAPCDGVLATIVDCSKVSGFKTRLGADYDVAPLPFIDDSKTIRYANYSGLKFYGINPGRAATHMDLANRVAKYLVSESAQLERFNVLKYKPTLSSLLNRDDIANEPHIKALTTQGDKNTVALTAVDSSLWSQAAVAIKSIQKLPSNASDADYSAILKELDDSLYK